MMKRILSAGVGLFACAIATQPSLAADLPIRGPVYMGPVAAPLFNWSGFYLGGHAGYGWGKYDVDTATVVGGVVVDTASNSFNLDGWLAGGQIGFNWQVNQLVYGIEGDMSWSNIGGDFQYDPLRPEAIAGADIEWLATLRGRVGIAYDRTLLYATGGLAWGKDFGFANSVIVTGDRASASGMRTGWAAGGGLEHAVTDNLSIKAEYLYVDLGDDRRESAASTFPPGLVLRADSDIHLHVIRAGLNYRFATGNAPAMANY
jgi:outer membrane immunogenic protein